MATQTISKKVSLASGATTINLNTVTVTSTIALFVGAVLEHANIPAGTTVTAITSFTGFTMSANATASGSSLTIVALNPDSVNVDDIALYGDASVIRKWSNDDLLVINDGITVNVTTDQTKYWKTITVNNGKFKIANTSTVSGISFGMGRGSNTTVNSISTGTGLGSIEVDGDWIQIGTGSGADGQTITTPFRDFIPAVWVETGNGTGVYEKWVNVTCSYAESPLYHRNNLDWVSAGNNGKFFYQTAATSYIKHFTLTGGSSVNTSRIITVTSTTGVVPGASITGTGITANSTVQRIVSSTQLEVNITPTTSAGPNTFTIVNPYRAQLEAQIVFGDNVHGTRVPTNAKIRCPNIMVTDYSPANVAAASLTLTGAMTLNIGTLTIDTALFDEMHLNLTQAQTVSISNAAFCLPMIVSECYAFTMTNTVLGLIPVRNYYSTSWLSRESTWGSQTQTWSYINGASVTDTVFAATCFKARSGNDSSVTAPSALLSLSYTSDAVFNNLVFYQIASMRNYTTAIYGSANVNECTFTNIKVVGSQGAINLTTSLANTVDNITVQEKFWNECTGFGTSGWRVGMNPATGAKLVDGTKYYFKVRSYRDWTNKDLYVEGRVVSATPYLSPDKYHPLQFGAINAGSASNILTWIRAEPQAGSTAWEIFRSTTQGFTARDATTRQVTSATEATVTYTDNVAGLLGAPVNGTTYYYVLRKWNSTGTVASTTGTSGQYTLTTSNNFNTARGTVVNCNALTGSTIVTALTSNFVTSGIIAGMAVSGAGIPANTKVASVQNYQQITLDTATNAVLEGVTLTFGLAPGMLIEGTNVAQNARIVTIDSNTQITVDKPHTGAVSTTITFADVTESAEQEVYTHGAATTVTNYCFQSNIFTSGTWVKTTMTPTDATGNNAPMDTIYVAGNLPTTTSARLVSSGANATAVQTIGGLTAGLDYTASIYVYAAETATVPGVAGALIFGTTTTTFTATSKWKRITATFQATGTSHTFTIRIDVSGRTMYVAHANVHLGTSALIPVTTTTAAVALGAQELSSILPFTRLYSDETANQGIQIALNAAPTGTHWTDIFMGTTSNFTPSDLNRVASTWSARSVPVILNNANNNEISDVSALGYSGNVVYLAYLVGSSNNRLLNFTWDFNYSTATMINASNLSNNNLFHNWVVKQHRNYIATNYPIVSVNNCSGLTFQNLKLDKYDIAYNNQFLDCVLKGVSGGNATPATTATTYALGSTTDSNAIAYTGVYDYIFNEFYDSINTGSLKMVFNASSKAIKPYSILAGNPVFGNSGKLYITTPNDSIEYTWPHKIYGVSGFRNILPKLNGVDLGNDATLLFGLKVEYSINTGSGYGAYKRATGINLAGETVSASAGFNIKIKITAREFMKVGNPSTQFVIGETINGATSGATAVVDEVECFGTTANTIAISSRSGTFTATENIRDSTNTVRAANVATNTFAIGPSFTSYIDALRIFTTVDQSVNYSLATNVTCTVTCKNASTGALVQDARVYILAGAGGLETEGTIIFNGLTNSSGIIQFIYPYISSQPITGKVRRGSSSPFYKPNQIVASIGSSGLDQTIFLIPDE